jgi:hypothetical protein
MSAMERGIMNKQQDKIEELERQYFAALDIPDHRWGEKEEENLGAICAELGAAYDEAGTDEFDRIQL